MGSLVKPPLRTISDPQSQTAPDGLRQPDAELMARAGGGDRAAWHALYARHRDLVYATACRFLGNQAAARDVTQDIFVSLFSHARAYRPTASFSSYLRRVTVNRCLNEQASARNRYRQRSSEPELETIAARDLGAEALLERGETEAAVRAAIAALPERQRMAVVLARFEGLSYEDVALALDCSVSSVESLLFRARQKLAELLAGTQA
jgi:RNA polymerase sigma-70 factor, ECF subfamily